MVIVMIGKLLSLVLIHSDDERHLKDIPEGYSGHSLE